MSLMIGCELLMIGMTDNLSEKVESAAEGMNTVIIS